MTSNSVALHGHQSSISLNGFVKHPKLKQFFKVIQTDRTKREGQC